MSEAVLDARSHPYFLEFRLPKETLLQQIPRKKYLIKSSLSSSVPTVAPNTTALVDRIRATRSGARIDAPCSEIASAAMNDAVQLVALAEVNCCVAPKLTVAVAGEIVCGGGGPVVTNFKLNTGPNNVPGFSTCSGSVAGEPCQGLTFSVVELTNVVPKLFPPTNTVAPFLNPLPVRVSVGLPVGAGLGDTLVIDGPGGATLT